MIGASRVRRSAHSQRATHSITEEIRDLGAVACRGAYVRVRPRLRRTWRTDSLFVGDCAREFEEAFPPTAAVGLDAFAILCCAFRSQCANIRRAAAMPIAEASRKRMRSRALCVAALRSLHHYSNLADG